MGAIRSCCIEPGLHRKPLPPTSTLNELASAWDTDSSRRLRIVVEFVKDAVKILNERTDHVRIHIERAAAIRETFYDHAASMIFGRSSALRQSNLATVGMLDDSAQLGVGPDCSTSITSMVTLARW